MRFLLAVCLRLDWVGLGRAVCLYLQSGVCILIGLVCLCVWFAVDWSRETD